MAGAYKAEQERRQQALQDSLAASRAKQTQGTPQGEAPVEGVPGAPAEPQGIVIEQGAAKSAGAKSQAAPQTPATGDKKEGA